jgi:hypothetical protein
LPQGLAATAAQKNLQQDVQNICQKASQLQMHI